MKFEEPPTWHQSPYHKFWTDDIETYRRDRVLYEYLPSVIMHEFGHVLGLGHGGGATIMNGHHYLGTITETDKNAAKAIYQRHVAH